MTTTTHAELISHLEEQFRPVFEGSPDGVYLWLDEAHKACNARLAELFGYTVAEWRAVPSFLEAFVDGPDQHMYAWNYQNRVVPLAFPVSFRFRGRRKDGSNFAAETDMIPISFDGHAIAYHFVRQVGP